MDLFVGSDEPSLPVEIIKNMLRSQRRHLHALCGSGDLAGRSDSDTVLAAASLELFAGVAFAHRWRSWKVAPSSSSGDVTCSPR